MLAAKFGGLHSEEMRAREVFDEKLAKHFLSTMFRGMGDYPPPFATEKPPVFDDKLPKLSLQVRRSIGHQDVRWNQQHLAISTYRDVQFSFILRIEFCNPLCSISEAV